MNKRLLFLSCVVVSLLLSACGMEVCDFCGQKKFCKEFDILGVTRYICNDCLNNPLVAVSGNMVRTYSEMYENGTLEYPEGSPMRDDYGAEPTEAPTDRPMPSLTDDIHVSNPGGSGTPGETAAAANASPTPATPTPAESVAGALTGSALADKLNASLANDNMLLVPKDGDGNEYMLYSGNTDLNIRFKRQSGSNADKDQLTIEQRDGASSSDYVKAAIRSILAYMDTDDYDGLGHDIYNQAIQKSEFRYEGLVFRSTVHTADEIEKGSAISEFSITP